MYRNKKSGALGIIITIIILILVVLFSNNDNNTSFVENFASNLYAYTKWINLFKK